MTANLIQAIALADDLHLWQFDTSPTPYVHLRELTRAIGYQFQDKRKTLDKWGRDLPLLPLSPSTVTAIHSKNSKLPRMLRHIAAEALLPVEVFLAHAEVAIATFAPTHRENLRLRVADIAHAWRELQAQQRGEEDVSTREDLDSEEDVSAQDAPSSPAPAPTPAPRPTLRERMVRSFEDFDRHVAPVLPQLVPGLEEVIPIERVTGRGRCEVAMDMIAGIDYLLRCRKVAKGYDVSTLIGLSARVQSARRSWRTFTVSCSSRSARTAPELLRRSDALRSGTLTASLVVQGYVSEDRSALLEAASAPWQAVVDAVADALLSIPQDAREAWHRARSADELRSDDSPVFFRHNRSDGTIFAVVPWHAVEGVEVVTATPRQAAQAADDLAEVSLWGRL